MAVRSILVSLALLAPLTGLAQAPEQGSAPAESEPATLAPPPIVPAPAESETARPAGELIPRPYEPQQSPGAGISVGRVTLEFLGGTVGELSLGLVGLAVGAGANPCNGNDSSSCFSPLLVGGILGMTMGIPLGVYAVGSWMDGRGSYLPSLLGTIIGAGLGTLIAVSTDDPIATAIGLTWAPSGAPFSVTSSPMRPGSPPRSRLLVAPGPAPRWCPRWVSLPRVASSGGSRARSNCLRRPTGLTPRPGPSRAPSLLRRRAPPRARLPPRVERG